MMIDQKAKELLAKTNADNRRVVMLYHTAQKNEAYWRAVTFTQSGFILVVLVSWWLL